MVVGEIKRLHRFAGDAEKVLEPVPDRDHDGQGIATADQANTIERDFRQFAGHGRYGVMFTIERGADHIRLRQYLGQCQLNPPSPLWIARVVGSQIPHKPVLALVQMRDQRARSTVKRRI